MPWGTGHGMYATASPRRYSRGSGGGGDGGKKSPERAPLLASAGPDRPTGGLESGRSPAAMGGPLLDAALKTRAVAIVAGLVAVNVVLLAMLFVAGTRYPGLVSPGILAYTFGLRCVGQQRITSSPAAQ